MAVLSPIFFHDEWVGFAANLAHKSDIGGPVPGSCWSQAREIYQEGLHVPPIKFVHRYQTSKDIEAAGERERSKLDYRNAPSDLTPAQKDLLNQDRIPWESRQLIKIYFQAVKPTQTK